MAICIKKLLKSLSVCSYFLIFICVILSIGIFMPSSDFAVVIKRGDVIVESASDVIESTTGVRTESYSQAGNGGIMDSFPGVAMSPASASPVSAPPLGAKLVNASSKAGKPKKPRPISYFKMHRNGGFQPKLESDTKRYVETALEGWERVKMAADKKPGGKKQETSEEAYLNYVDDKEWTPELIIDSETFSSESYMRNALDEDIPSHETRGKRTEQSTKPSARTTLKNKRFKNKPATRKCTSEERNAYVQQQCEHNGGVDYHKLLSNETRPGFRQRYIQGLTVDDEHKLLVCFQEMTGSTTFLSLLVLYSKFYKKFNKPDIFSQIHNISVLEQFGLTRLYKYSDSEILKRLKTYTKIMTVRNPMNRVYSAYKRKIGERKNYCAQLQRSLGKKMLLKSRGKLTPEQEKCGNGVTFPEFMEYFNEESDEILRDVHWRDYGGTCSPCHVKYDHILRLETGHSDELFLINKYLDPKNRETGEIFIKNNAKAVNETQAIVNNFRELNRNFKNITQNNFNKIQGFYEETEELFGYTSELTANGMKTSCTVETQSGDACC